MNVHVNTDNEYVAIGTVYTREKKTDTNLVSEKYIQVYTNPCQKNIYSRSNFY